MIFELRPLQQFFSHIMTLGLCEMEPRLRLKRFLSQAGIEPGPLD